ncbi:hypothetical protein MA20_06600 [Bradyrhizobium japonicum]|uniref:Uncharacterized protein n=1 Tax=Bradyrhizobium japonicum TaxID=375 RepID=A0A0A3Y6S0_BRAJP|nr:hypothetical protein MA20_06600 [Bradyrhizobium japonicum]
MPILIKGGVHAMQTIRSQADAHLAQGYARQQLNSAQQKGGRACDRLFVIPGRAEREPGISRCRV